MRKLILALLVMLAPATARADVGIGIFLGEPTGLDLKFGLASRSALDIVVGESSFREGRLSYGHLTYLITPFFGRGESVLIPLRLGIGAAMFGILDDDVNVGVRVPFEVGIRFRNNPLEIYGEIALLLVVVDENDNNKFTNVQGGIGLRFYF
jgi:hypothetical protein